MPHANHCDIEGQQDCSSKMEFFVHKLSANHMKNCCTDYLESHVTTTKYTRKQPNHRSTVYRACTINRKYMSLSSLSH